MLSALKAVYLNTAGQATNVWIKRNEVSVGNLHNGTGIGLYTNTLIGSVRLDFGMGGTTWFTMYFSTRLDF